ncbi:unnamed protein product, partial [Brenthis ino]
MATLWNIVVVLVFIQQVIAVQRDCSDFDNLKSCNECIRCGGNWCKNKNENHRCSLLAYDNWCTQDKEDLLYFSNDKEEGAQLNPKYQTQTLKVGNDDKFNVVYPSKMQNPKTELTVNSTQSYDFDVKNTTSCYDGTCTTSIYVKPNINFCGHNASPTEFFNVKLAVEGITEEANLKVHVPCACSFNDKIEETVVISCNGRGTNVGGKCICHQGWTGKFCDERCGEKRGDVPCTDLARNNGECSGNGKCGSCEKCECFTDREGSQYFDKDNYCADICTMTNYCDDCFLQPYGKCRDCHFSLYKQHYNETVLDQKDDLGRKVWVKCSVNIEEIYIEYIVMRDDRDETFFMILESGNGELVGAVSGEYIRIV